MSSELGSGAAAPGFPVAARQVAADWQAAIIVCAKCSRRIDGGFGPKGRTSLAKALRRLISGKKGRKAGFGVVESGCLKVCPKNGVVAIHGAEPGRWRIISRGTDPLEAARQIGLLLDHEAPGA